MANIPELRLVTNRFGDTSLVYEGRAYKLKYTGKRKNEMDSWLPNFSKTDSRK
ncbi:hypothetical protein T01_12682 [Trichinella spiralis]|uniref:Uncharacterized protein n=1 Tax=Trichinella spiralis TaxID=6334 RepID=A0A0V1AY79_TRISP|nr:hypothetical protein T01_12682 [Trichinella spiralis]